MDKVNKDLKETNQSVEKLRDNLDKVDVKMHDVSVSAKDVANTYKKEFQDVMDYITLQMSKIGAIITELNTHVGQAIDKNIEAGEKLAKKMEESGEKSISVLKVKAIKTEALMSSLLQNSTSKAAEQAKQFEIQLMSNKKLLETTVDDINKKKEDETTEDEKIGFFNLKAHKKNVEGHISELNKYKGELEAATLRTEMQYNTMASHYNKDSKEFKKVQDDKKAELDKLKVKTEEVDKKLKESNSSYLAVWKNQHNAIGTELEGLKKKIDDEIKKQTKGFDDFVTKFDEGMTTLETGIDSQAAREKELNQKKYDKKTEALEKELAKVRSEVTKNEEEKKRLEKEQAEANKLAKKYRNDIQEIEKHFIDNSEEKENSSNTDINNNNADAPSDEDVNQEVENQKHTKWLGTEEEIEAAKQRIIDLEELAKAEEQIATDKQTKIETANSAIVESERSVLLEQMRIIDEKTKLEEEKVKKDAEIEAKAQKRKDKLAKLEKIKTKAQHVVKIAEAVGSVAKGVAEAWALGPFIGPPMAALVAIQGAMQIKTMTEQLKYMEDGGLLNGKRHRDGGMRIQGTNIEVEGGEYVVNRQSTAKNLGLLRYINEQRGEVDSNDLYNFFSTPFPRFQRPEYMNMLENGGQVPMLPMSNNLDVDRLLSGMQNIKIEPHVSVTDIHTVQQQMVQVDEWVGM